MWKLFVCCLLVAEIVQLRQKFEEDKRQIAAMKAARKFRPYWLCRWELGRCWTVSSRQFIVGGCWRRIVLCTLSAACRYWIGLACVRVLCVAGLSWQYASCAC